MYREEENGHGEEEDNQNKVYVDKEVNTSEQDFIEGPLYIVKGDEEDERSRSGKKQQVSVEI